MASQRNIKEYDEGEILFHEGDTGDKMYIIQSGSVAVIKSIGDDEIVLAKLQKSDFFGEMALLGDSKRTATIKAIEKTKAIVIEEVIFKAQLKKTPDWFASMFKVLIKRIRDMNKKIKSRFKMGIQFSVINIVYLVSEKFGTMEDEKFVVNKDLMIEKIHTILGISKKDIIKLLSEIKFIHIIEIDERANKILIPDRDRLEKFIEYIHAKSHLKPGEKLETKLSNIDEKMFKYLEQLSNLLKRGQEDVIAFVQE